jgi:hypothetical protein
MAVEEIMAKIWEDTGVETEAEAEMEEVETEVDQEKRMRKYRR